MRGNTLVATRRGPVPERPGGDQEEAMMTTDGYSAAAYLLTATEFRPLD
jgi:hypothetical protein